MAVTTIDPRREVLAAAAAIARESGSDAISIKALTARSGVSNGSIYHHFGSRDGVIASLVLDVFAGYQGEVVELLEAHAEDAEGGIKDLITHHLDWVEWNPDEARLLMVRRDEVAAGDHGRRLAEQNREFLEAVGGWLDAQAESGRMPAIGIDLAHALAFAPAQEIGALWLAGRIAGKPSDFANRLAPAGWAAILAVPI
jgi:AcrR family transcriptional regulator